ncbi:MAG: LytTR family DNA-binding domain-containing protein [Anaerocolumna sp.]
MVDLLCVEDYDGAFKLIIKNSIKLYSINLNDIYFFEKYGRKLEIVLNNKRISIYSSFIQLEKILKVDYFYQCHKSYIVNYKKIFEIDKDEIIFKEIKEYALVSQNYKEKLIELITTIK